MNTKQHEIPYKEISCVLLCVLAFFFTWFGAVKAEGPRLTVSPHTFEFSVKRGQILEDKIRILNQSGMPISILAKTSDFSAENETGQMRFDSQSEDPSFAARKWLNIKNPNFILDPGETEIVDFSVGIPRNAEPGGHYATILFEPQLPSNYFKEGEPRVIPVIGVIFLFSVETGGKLPSFEPVTVAEFDIPDKYHLKKLEDSLVSVVGLFAKARAQEKPAFSIVGSAFLPFSLRIRNSNIYHTKPYGELAITGSGGKVLGRTEISKTTILPGKMREITASFQPEGFLFLKKYLPPALYGFLNRNFIWGKYRAKLDLTVEKPKGVIFSSAESADGRIAQTIEFWIFPWKTAAILMFLIIMGVLIRKRLVMAARILIGKQTFKS